jgi:adenine phosphoribosyltransferase
MADYLDLIDDTTGGPRADVTPIFADRDAFAALVRDLAGQLENAPVDLVAGIDALGFILGTALALHLGRGFVPVRKAGKLPGPAHHASLVDYTGQEKALALRVGAVWPGARVLLVDEWIETGAQARAAIELIEGQGGIVAGVAAINIDWNEPTRRRLQGYRCVAVQSSGE